MYNKRCAYCGEPINIGSFTVDHCYPKCRGGKAVLRNVKPSCKFCNGLKSCLTIDEFREKILKNLTDEKLGEKLKHKYKIAGNNVEFYFETTEKEHENYAKLLKIEGTENFKLNSMVQELFRKRRMEYI